MDVVVLLQQRGSLEGGERFAAARGVPDVAVAVVFVDALDDVLHGIDLIRAHDHELLLAREQHHVTADGAAEVALFQEVFGELVELGDLSVIFTGELIDGQEALVGIEGEVAGVVVGEVVAAVAVTDDEQLHEAEQRLAVAIAGIALVFNDLLHGPTGIHAERLQLDLHTGHAVDEQDDVVTVVAVVSVDAQLVDHLEVVFAPVLEVHQRVVQRCAIVASEGVDAAQDPGGGVDIRGYDFIQQPGELGFRQLDAVQSLELLAEILLQCRTIPNVVAVFVLQVLKCANEAVFDMFLPHRVTRPAVGLRVGGRG